MRPLTLLATSAFLLAPAIARADLELVFAIDTTGSMSGEIREAKERVKQIAEALAESRKGERIRLGVVAYRDRGDAYVTKVSELSDDIDATFTFLGTLTADGGGDTPEDVLSGLDAALTKISWTLHDARVERQVFLIGDASPHLDYPERTPDAIIAAALEKEIVINAIGCRSLSPDGVQIFRRIAYATEGTYQHIGRVSTNPAGGELAKAMLSALSREDPSDAKKDAIAIALRSTQGTLAAADLPERTIQVKPIATDARKEACAIRVAIPRGTHLEKPPAITRAKDRLFVELDLKGAAQPGASSAHDYALETCFPITLPVTVSFGG